MTKKVKIVEWENDSNTSDGTPCYRIDQPGEGDRLFRDLLNNSEDNDTLTLKEVTDEEWAEIEANGAELA